MTLPEFSVRQRVLVNVLFVVCILAGACAAFPRIPIEFYPDVTLNGAVVTTIWTGASAEEVERLVTQRIEEEIGQVTDIQEMRSTSLANQSSILIDFDENLDDQGYESALNDLRAALDRVQNLPEDVEEPYLYEIIARAPAVEIGRAHV